MRLSPLAATLGILALPLAILASQPGCSDDDTPTVIGTGTEGSSLVVPAQADRGFTLGGENVTGLRGAGIFRFDHGALAGIDEAFSDASIEMGFGEDGVEVSIGEAVAFTSLSVSFENGVSVCTFDVQRSAAPGLPPGAVFQALCEGTVTNPLSIGLARGATGPLALTLALRPLGEPNGAWVYSEPLRVSATGFDAVQPALEIGGERILLR